MKKKYIIGINIVIILMLIIFSIIRLNTYKEYSKNYFYMDTYINVKVYSNNESKANEALEEIDNIYKNYHNLTNRYVSYDNGIYELNHKGNIQIDKRLYDMIVYADSWYKKTNGLLDISIGNVVDVWKQYREAGTGVPTMKELKSVNINNKDVSIKDTDEFSSKYINGEMLFLTDAVTLKNNVQIDLGAISKGYTTQLVGDYLKSVGITKYCINAGGNVLVGDHYKNSKYKIGIEDPNDSSKIFKIIKGNNIAVVTSGGYQRNYTYNGVTYNHIINPNTLFPANNMKSVTVIGHDSKEGDALSTTLFLMTVDEGKKFIKDYDVDVIWHTNDDQIITTDGVSQYE